MKVQTINVNFKGLFINKTKENNGNWKVEYSPYSWEMKNEKEFGMAPQKEWSVLDEKLPDNEKIYSNNKTYDNQYSYRECCKDILGTEFYYCDYKNNSLRKHITEVPAMNLEDSLRVKSKKLDVFLTEKNNKRYKLEQEFYEYKREIDKKTGWYKEYSEDYNEGILSRERNKDSNKYLMGEAHKEVVENAGKMYNCFKFQYKELRDTIERVIKDKYETLTEIERLETARENNNLIDISKRDIYDPNKALWEALQNIKACAGKIIALPHRTLSMKELISKIGKVSESEIATQGIKIVDQMIKSRI